MIHLGERRPDRHDISIPNRARDRVWTGEGDRVKAVVEGGDRGGVVDGEYRVDGPGDAVPGEVGAGDADRGRAIPAANGVRVGPRGAPRPLHGGGIEGVAAADGKLGPNRHPLAEGTGELQR
ncbi:MAG: hypothetical protein EBU21_16535, partial [Proteobacteria bacterium]|nr:hypothetical protein [Pseudomonadota bacterium]